MHKQKTYIGIHNEVNGGMTPIGNIIRDAWVFGIIPEHETCAGWSYVRIDDLYDKVSEAWAPYGHLVSQLPDELKQRHARIYAQAVAAAHTLGWDPALEDDENA